jgi:hypothetical protein
MVPTPSGHEQTKALSLVRIAGNEVEIAAPGLKQIKRKAGVDLYWAKDVGAAMRPARSLPRQRAHSI